MKYVAYGSNLSVSQMAIRCPDAKIVGTGKIHNYKLVFRYHADIEQHKGSYVPVLIWEISKADEAQLDLYEGVRGGYYHQKNIPVFMDNDEKIKAMVYVMNEQNEQKLPDSYYLQIIENGYEHFGFDKRILETALDEAEKQ